MAGPYGTQDSFYPQPLIQLRALITLLALNKLNDKKTEGSSVVSVVGNKEKRSNEKNFKWRENRD